VLAVLRRRIGEGSLAAGTRLMESPLALELGVSRAPVRHALAVLTSEGILRRAKGRGFLVEDRGLAAPATEVATPPDGALTLQPTWQGIYEVVEKAIVERISVASWRIVEVDLARHFGVSRTVAREVMARLHQRGLVKRDDKGRWNAPALTADYISELYEMRWSLEPLALAKASHYVPHGILVRMNENLANAMLRADALSGGELDQLETELHVDFLGYCGNATLVEALRLYQSLLVAHTFLYAASSGQFATEPFLPEHARIVAHLLDGRVAEAAQAMEQHLRAARERAINRVETISRGLIVSELPYMRPMTLGTQEI
jgi:DNA-binding GntR family transcriptional regulator